MITIPSISGRHDSYRPSEIFTSPRRMPRPRFKSALPFNQHIQQKTHQRLVLLQRDTLL